MLSILPQGRVRCADDGFVPFTQADGLMCFETCLVMPTTASDAAAGMFAWQNNSGMPFVVTSAYIVAEAAPTVGTINLELGIAATAIQSATLISQPTVATGVFASQNPRTAVVAVASQVVGAGQWITLTRTLGATAGFRGWVVVKGIYTGQLDQVALGHGTSVCPNGRVGVPEAQGFVPYGVSTGYPVAPYVVEAPITPNDAAGGLFAWYNPFPFAVLLEGLEINVQTGSTGASTFSFGQAAAPNVLNATLLSGINGQTVQVVASAVPLNTSGTYASRTVAAGQWVTGSVASGASAGMVGRVHLSVVPLGTVIN